MPNQIWTGDSSAHLAKSLLRLYTQCNSLSPLRDRDWDGSIGDTAHQGRESDHNPSGGIVYAIDITHDPAHGMDMQQIADQIIASRDPRVKYLIHNGRISNPTIQNWAWRERNKGPDDHTHHLHVSVNSVGADDAADWAIQLTTGGKTVQTFPLLRLGSQGTYVRELQQALGIKIDGTFGTDTLAAVKAFQASQQLAVDGDVGPQTWQRLLSATKPAKLNTDIKTTVFNDTKLRYGPVPSDTLGVSLPAIVPSGTLVWVTNRANGFSAIGPVIDLGPWNTEDPYWVSGARPQAESGTDKTGRQTNKAGIDIYPEMAHALGVQFIESGGKITAGEGQVDWGFLWLGAQPVPTPTPVPEPTPTPTPVPTDLAHAVAALMAATATLQDTNKQLQAAIQALQAAIGTIPKTGTAIVPVPQPAPRPTPQPGLPQIDLLPILGDVLMAATGGPAGQAKAALDVVGRILTGLRQQQQQ